jgi:uncharacterized protein (TIGR00255 family)
MTGYGLAPFDVEGVSFEVEVRALNHRFLDLRLRLPRATASHETELRELIQQRLRRGKVEVAVHVATGSPGAQGVEFNSSAAEQYLSAAQDLQRRHGLSGTIDVGTLLRLPGVARVVERSVPPEALYEGLRAALQEALTSAEAMRKAEGAALARELEARLARVAELAQALEERSQLVQRAVRERLRKRTELLRDETGHLDEPRLHQEIVIAADRLDVTEEIARLRSHVEQFRSILAAPGGDPAGRRLGFLLQEMGREVNTIGSKGADAPIALQVVELKMELERLREQVQNVE